MSTISASTTSTTAYKVTADTTGKLVLQTGSGPTDAVTIDTSQNVGVGTSSPAQKLEVAGTIKSTSSTGAIFQNSTATGSNALRIVNSSGSVYFGTENSAGTDYSLPAYAPFVYANYSTPICFVSNGSERARIDTNGNLLVGVTSTSNASVIQTATTNAYSLQAINTAASNPYGINSKYSGAAPNSGGFEFLMCQDTSSARMYVRSNGGISNFSANNTNLSDRREKMNFAPAKSYLDVICAIPVQTYNYIDQNLEEDDGLTLGVVAQDVQAVAPELVTESDWSAEKDGSKMRLSIYQTDMQYALMKCIQELKAELDAAKADIATLKGAA